MVLSQGHYAGRLFFKSAQTLDWTPAQTPAASAVGGKRLHVDAGSIYATSEAGVWRTDNGATFDVVTDQPARQAVVHGDALLFGPLEPWNYVMSIDLSEATGGGVEIEYLGGMNEAESFLLASDGSEVVSSVRDHGLQRLNFATEKWEQISPTRRPVADFADTADSYWLLTEAGRLFRSTDAQRWELQPIGEHRGARILAHHDAVFIVTQAGDFVALRPGHIGWVMSEPVALSEGTASSVVGYDDSLLVSFAPRILSGRGGSTPVGGGLFLAENRAEHWSDWNRIGEELPEDYDYRQTPPVYAAHAEDGLFVVVAKDGLYRSVDGGESWARGSLEQPFDSSYLHAERAWLARGEQGLFALTMSASGMHLRKSDDNGESWRTVVRSPDASVTPSALVTDGPNLLVGTWEEGVLVSTDGGESWQPLADGFDDAPVRDLHLRGSTLWAATTDGVMHLE
jgi:hypothetical protein